MTRKKVLDYFTIEGTPGGCQDWLPEWDMNMGGCAAVTACDTCIFLSRLDEKFRSLYPFDPVSLSRSDFVKFASIMKPFLTPRYHGIDFLETYKSCFRSSSPVRSPPTTTASILFSA